MTKEELAGKSKQELHAIAKELGLDLHHATGADKVKEAILAAGNDDELPPFEDSLAEIADEPLTEDQAAEEVVPVHTAKQNAPTEPPKAGPELATPDTLKSALSHYVNRGLHIVELTDIYFHLRVANREAAGNMKQPLKTIVQQADLLFNRTKEPTEE